METADYYYRARMMDPSIGRFSGKDPVKYLNLYRYVKNNPMRLKDPSGKIVGGDDKIDSDYCENYKDDINEISEILSYFDQHPYDGWEQDRAKFVDEQRRMIQQYEDNCNEEDHGYVWSPSEQAACFDNYMGWIGRSATISGFLIAGAYGLSVGVASGFFSATAGLTEAVGAWGSFNVATIGVGSMFSNSSQHSFYTRISKSGWFILGK